MPPSPPPTLSPARRVAFVACMAVLIGCGLFLMADQDPRRAQLRRDARSVAVVALLVGAFLAPSRAKRA